jgi:adenine-specific DNA-methyltransferase
MSHQAHLGQFMTPPPIARFMAGMFSEPMPAKVRLLEPGAGKAALTRAFVDRWMGHIAGDLEVHAYEYDDSVTDALKEVLAGCEKAGSVRTQIFNGDFIEAAAKMIRLETGPRYSHAILNPPYKKINSDSKHREWLRAVGLETVNLYTGFLGLVIELLESGGQAVTIIPRSFCNGPYYRPFREFMFQRTSIRHIHLFESRSKAFKADAVLQENVIIHLVRDAPQGDVMISTSTDDTFADYTERQYPFVQIVFDGDSEKFIHIPTGELEAGPAGSNRFQASLSDIGIGVSTGPVVDFRLRKWLRKMPEKGTVPLLYSGHFSGTEVQWPIPTLKKPNAIERAPETEKWLYPNGFYTIVRRFSSKEEKRRIVASVVDPATLPADVLGFENHLNVFHNGSRQPMPELLARGLSVFLNSTAIDQAFRRFNGHTQVNATDLRQMSYPDLESLLELGAWAKENMRFTQEAIDEKVMSLAMPHEKAEAAVEILRQLGFPRGQLNERSGLVLLAILNLMPKKQWRSASNPLIGITPIMDWIAEHYSKKYAPNTRETVRRQTMHQFMQAGLVLYNPDDALRPVNSPHAVYQVSPEALSLLRTYGTGKWDAQLAAYMSEQTGLVARYAQERDLQRIPVTILDGKVIHISPGEHSLLIKAIVEEFAERFVPGGRLVYVGDTGDKLGYFDERLLNELDVQVDSHGKMPDVVLYYPERNWLLLAESVTSHGPVDGKRHDELMTLFKGSSAGLVYVTAFPSRPVMARYLSPTCAESRVRCGRNKGLAKKLPLHF